MILLVHRADGASLNDHPASKRALSQFLITIDDALRALAEARTPEQLIGLGNKAEAMRRYAQRARLGMAAQNRCAEIRLRAERKLGQYLAGTPRNSGGRPKPVPLGNGFPTLEDLGITRKLSHRAQRLAAIPANDFEWYLGTAAEQELEITTRLLLYHSERRQATAENRQRIVGGRIDDLIEFAAAGNRMGCIVVDPPWPTLGSILPYHATEVDELMDLPIPELGQIAAMSMCGRSPTPITEQLTISSNIGDFALCRNSFGAKRRLERATIGECRMKSSSPLYGARMI